MHGAGEEALQGSSFDACVIQLARGAGGRGEALDLIALHFPGAADDCERGCLARAGKALDSLDAVRRAEHILYHALLCPVEMRVLVGKGDGVWTREDWFRMVLSLTHRADNFMFRLDGFRGGELAARNAKRPVNDLKFSGSQAGVKIGADLGMGDLAHSATKPVADQRTFIHNRLALEVLVAGKGERFSNTVKRVDRLLLMLRPFPRCPYDRLGLVSKICRQPSVRGHYFSRRMNFFAVTRGVRSDLSSFLPGVPGAFEVVTNLLAAGT